MDDQDEQTGQAPRRFRLGIDVGGTFTDFVLEPASGNTIVHKVLSTPADPSIAVLEGIALRAVELIEALAPGDPGTISIDGGLANNRGLVRFLADAIGRPVALRSHTDLTALGAAELGYIGLGLPVPRRRDAEDVAVSPSAASELIRSHRRRFAGAIAAVRSIAADRW